jgi:hypothetical protein
MKRHRASANNIQGNVVESLQPLRDAIAVGPQLGFVSDRTSSSSEQEYGEVGAPMSAAMIKPQRNHKSRHRLPPPSGNLSAPWMARPRWV